MVEKGQCWKCNSDNIAYDKNVGNIDGESVVYTYFCADCGAKGQEIYNLEFVENKRQY